MRPPRPPPQDEISHGDRERERERERETRRLPPSLNPSYPARRAACLFDCLLLSRPLPIPYRPSSLFPLVLLRARYFVLLFAFSVLRCLLTFSDDDSPKITPVSGNNTKMGLVPYRAIQTNGPEPAAVRELPEMMSANFSDFLTPSLPPC